MEFSRDEVRVGPGGKFAIDQGAEDLVEVRDNGLVVEAVDEVVAGEACSAASGFRWRMREGGE